MEKKNNLTIDEIKSIIVNKDDVIIVTVDPDKWDFEQCAGAYESIRKMFPDNRVLMTAKGITVDSYSKQEVIDLLTED